MPDFDYKSGLVGFLVRSYVIAPSNQGSLFIFVPFRVPTSTCFILCPLDINATWFVFVVHSNALMSVDPEYQTNDLPTPNHIQSEASILEMNITADIRL